jgi:hypothetical protein
VVGLGLGGFVALGDGRDLKEEIRQESKDDDKEMVVDWMGSRLDRRIDVWAVGR